MLQTIKSWLGYPPAEAPKRDSRWPAVRGAHIKAHPECAVCSRKDHLEVHHKTPFQLDRSLELDPRNLITLCDPGPGGCHLMFGHLGDWKSWNKTIDADAMVWALKITNRPYIVAKMEPAV